MTENLKKATELLAKYGFAMDATMASNERAEIAILSACKTFLALSTEMPIKDKEEVAEMLSKVAWDLHKYYSGLSDACQDLYYVIEDMRCEYVEKALAQDEHDECAVIDELKNLSIRR